MNTDWNTNIINKDKHELCLYTKYVLCNINGRLYKLYSNDHFRRNVNNTITSERMNTEWPFIEIPVHRIPVHRIPVHRIPVHRKHHLLFHHLNL